MSEPNEPTQPEPAPESGFADNGAEVEYREPRHFTWIRRLAMLSVLGLFALVTLRYSPWWPVAENTPPEKHPAVGHSLSLLELDPLTGGGDALTLSDISGKVVLLNFWGTWCPPCRQEIPHIDALHREYGQRDDFLLLAVSCSGQQREDLDSLRKETSSFLEQRGLTLPTYADTNSATREAYDSIGGFRGYPTTVLIDREGVVRMVWTGYYPGVEEQMAEGIRTLLEQ